MMATVFFAVGGVLLLLVGGFALHSFHHQRAIDIRVVYMLIFSGVLFVSLAILIAISRIRYYGKLRGLPDRGSSGGASSDGLYTGVSGDHFGHGYGGDCGHAGGHDGGCGGGDGGGGH